MYFDGSLKLVGAGAGILLISPDRKQLKYVLQILWQATNNEAEHDFYNTINPTQGLMPTGRRVVARPQSRA